MSGLPHLDVYRLWQQANRLTYARQISVIGLVVSTFMIGFDEVFVRGGHFYLSMRMFGVVSLFANILFVNWLQKRKASPRSRIFASAAMLLTMELFWVVYVRILYFMPPYNFFVYFIGMLLVVVFGTLMLQTYWLEQYIFSCTCILTSVVLLLMKQGNSDSLNIAIIATIVSTMLAYYHRRQFVGSLVQRYRLLSVLVPRQIAHHIVITNDESVELPFVPIYRFTVCLCADWRHFQRLCKQNSPEKISALLEIYYDIVLETLERCVPNGTFFATWTADELFVTFYDDFEDEATVVSNALSFASLLATEVYLKIARLAGDETIVYDIGLASGIGLLGLQGPRTMKKTTTIGEVAGVAKRLEQEAKARRRDDMTLGPTIIFDQEIATSALEAEFDLGALKSAQPILAATKDVDDKPCYYWVPTGPVTEDEPGALTQTLPA